MSPDMPWCHVQHPRPHQSLLRNTPGTRTASAMSIALYSFTCSSGYNQWILNRLPAREYVRSSMIKDCAYTNIVLSAYTRGGHLELPPCPRRARVIREGPPQHIRNRSGGRLHTHSFTPEKKPPHHPKPIRPSDNELTAIYGGPIP